MTTRVSPPVPGKGVNPVKVNAGPNLADQPGRTYSCAVGSTLDVPDHDALQLATQGWFIHGVSCPTSGRPVSANKGTVVIDTTLNAAIIWDQTQWRNVVTGAVV